MTYEPHDHFWRIREGARAGQLFSSAKPGYVAEDDAAYQAWLKGRLGDQSLAEAPQLGPTHILCDGELAHVLAKRGLGAASAAAGATDLGGLSAVETLELVEARGVELTFKSTPALSAVYEVSGRPWTDMRDEAHYIASFGGFAAEATSLVWQARDKSVTFDSPDHFRTVVRALADYLAQWKRHLAGNGERPALGTVSIA